MTWTAEYKCPCGFHEDDRPDFPDTDNYNQPCPRCGKTLEWLGSTSSEVDLSEINLPAAVN